MLAVPNESGSPTGPPEPKSASQTFRARASYGAKKSVACSEPSPWTLSLTQDCASTFGGGLPGVGCATRSPLPVATMKVPGPSDIGPPPLCQMPAPGYWAAADQRARTAPLEDTPMTHPW
jgi:hypothetical protein